MNIGSRFPVICKKFSNLDYVRAKGKDNFLRTIRVCLHQTLEIQVLFVRPIVAEKKYDFEECYEVLGILLHISFLFVKLVRNCLGLR